MSYGGGARLARGVSIASWATLGGAERINNLALEDVVFEVAHKALATAGLHITEVDTVVTACSDMVDGRAISNMALSGAAGGYMRDATNLSSASEHALLLGAMRVASGDYRNCLVVGWSKTSEGDYDYLTSLGSDPFFERNLGLSSSVAWAIQASRLATVEAAPEPGAIAYWPVAEADMPKWTDGACAFVLTEESRDLAIAGLGWSTESYSLGARAGDGLHPLTEAARQAYAQAGIESHQVTVAELSDPTPQHFDALVGALDLDLRRAGLTVNGGGSRRLFWPGFICGLWSLADLADNLSRSPGSSPTFGLAQGASGFAGQMQTVVVLRHGLDA